MYEFLWLHNDGTTSLLYFDAWEEEAWPGGNPEVWIDWECDEYETFLEKARADLGADTGLDEFIQSRLLQEYYEVQEERQREYE